MAKLRQHTNPGNAFRVPLAIRPFQFFQPVQYRNPLSVFIKENAYLWHPPTHNMTHLSLYNNIIIKMTLNVNGQIQSRRLVLYLVRALVSPALDARGQETAIHWQRGTGNITGRWRTEKGNGSSDVLGGATAL